eukprot:8464893-Lingulodinium_polyedra.AAC.1
MAHRTLRVQPRPRGRLLVTRVLVGDADKVGRPEELEGALERRHVAPRVLLVKSAAGSCRLDH